MSKKSSNTKTWVIMVALIIIVGFWIGNINDSSNKNGKELVQLTEGLSMRIIEAGSGDPIRVGSVAVVHYTGTLDDGTVFDSSIPRGEAFQFIVGGGQVIRGWDLGVEGMQPGEKRLLVIAPELAYGSTARGSIPANSTLTFEVELLAIR